MAIHDGGHRDVRGKVIAVVWRYRVRPESVAQFENAYGGAGAWAKLFAAAAGYIGTELLRDVDGTYLTIDRWQQQDDFDLFLAQHEAAYAGLDAVCDSWTLEETRLAVFEVLA
jgi:heme-degrading monooxygenase HmoA